MNNQILKLDNEWQILIDEHYYHDGSGIHHVTVDINRRNGDKWELAIKGQVKNDGCADWGFGQPVIMHFCGKEDAQIIKYAYDTAFKHIEEYEEL